MRSGCLQPRLTPAGASAATDGRKPVEIASMAQPERILTVGRVALSRAASGA